MISKLLSAAIVVSLGWFLDLPTKLGAHPFWGSNVVLIGGVGAIAALAILNRFDGWRVMIALFALSLVAYFSARIGKARFAASYAEDQFSGQIWYFGWIAVSFFFVWFIGLLVARSLTAMNNHNN